MNRKPRKNDNQSKQRKPKQNQCVVSRYCLAQNQMKVHRPTNQLYCHQRLCLEHPLHRILVVPIEMTNRIDSVKIKQLAHQIWQHHDDPYVRRPRPR